MEDLTAMEHAFVIVVGAVALVGIIGALIALLGGSRTWEALGRDHLLMESDLRDPRSRGRAARGGPAAAGAQEGDREQEIRQMLQARNERRRRRGEAECDIESELARLLRAGAADPPGVGGSTAGEPPDAELVAEIRQLVIARNHRRARRGEAPLDVEAEIARQIARLNG
jgi:hypothetical protein